MRAPSCWPPPIHPVVTLRRSHHVIADACVARSGSGAAGGGPSNDNVLHTRTYDLYITYDKGYQTPTFWLMGYNELRQPLTVPEVCEDVSAEVRGRERLGPAWLGESQLRL